MQVLLIGFGSVGKRHFQTLSVLADEVHVVDQSFTEPAGDADFMFRYGSLEDVGQRYFDLIVIATWANSHLLLFSGVLKFNPKGILIEKPLANSIRACQEIIELAQQHNVRVLCNFTRSFTSMASDLRNFFELRGDKICRLEWHSDNTDCLMTTGLHWLNLAEMLFDADPKTASGRLELAACNPRSPSLRFLQGDLQFEFQGQRFLSMSTLGEKSSEVRVQGEETTILLKGGAFRLEGSADEISLFDTGFNFKIGLISAYSYLITGEASCLSDYNLRTTQNFLHLTLPMLVDELVDDGGVLISDREVPLS